MKQVITAVLALFSFSVLAQDAFMGKWGTNSAQIRFYSEMGTVNYDSCKTELLITPTAQNGDDLSFSIDKLKTTCSHPTYWDFHQVLPQESFVVNMKSFLVKDSTGKKAGTMTANKINLRWDIGGQEFFLDGGINAQGVFEVEWSSRSYEAVNFDIVNNLQRL